MARVRLIVQHALKAEGSGQGYAILQLLGCIIQHALKAEVSGQGYATVMLGCIIHVLASSPSS